jgi:hypothetical protein
MFLLPGLALAQEEEELIGVVKATEWEDDEVVSAVLMVTSEVEDEEGEVSTYIDEYMILDDRTGKELFKLNGKTVEVNAVFLEEDDGTVYLKVNSYLVIDANEEDPGEEDYDEEEIEEPPMN